MNVHERHQFHTLCIISLLLCLFLTGSLFAKAETYRLDNGMEVILKEVHSAPMISSMVFVKSGSKYESRFENGITHFLEHLLFDGTVNLTREELDLSISDLGGYINAFTRKEMTAFFVLLPKQYIDYGMTVQADMLFNSVFPEHELPKERKVVIEEINRTMDSPGYPAEQFFIKHAYAGTLYDRPVLGYRAFIENIPRKAIIDYWKRYYTPQNMTLLVIGDFDTPAMKELVTNVYGKIENPANAAVSESSKITPDTTAGLTGQQVFDTVATVKSTYINFSFAAPHYSDPDYMAMDVLSRYLNMDEVSPLTKVLTKGDEPLATEVSVSLTPYSEFSRLEISVTSDHPEKSNKIISTVLEQLKSMPSYLADESIIEGIKTTARCEDIYNSAKLHYYGFMIAPYMMTAGWDFVQTYAERLSKVQWADCQQTANKWLTNPRYVATVVKPVDDTNIPPYKPQGLTAEEVTAYFDTATFPEYDLVTGHTMEFPKTESIDFNLVDSAVYHREVLDNGLTLIIKSFPDNEVFAMNVLGKNRSANEPPDKTGITDFVNRCIEKGTVTRSARQLADDLARIGANVTLYDNPWIPYDDRYTSRRFSFMKFETIDEFAEKGFYLFSEMIFAPSFEPAEVENVRRTMLGVLGRDSSSPGKIARNQFYKTLFPDQPYGNPIMGTPRTINAITVDDLKAYHASFYSPENMIISIVTKRPVDEVLSWVKHGFGRYAKTGFTSATPKPPKVPTTITPVHTELDKEQVTFYLGSALPGANDPDAIPISIATSILSNRLYLRLREKEGLAYSVGAGAHFDRDFGWYYCVMGTSKDTYQKALDGILLQMEKIGHDNPLPSELQRSRNQMWGRLMSAKLSAINQAYYLAVDEYLGRPLEYDKLLLKKLTEVTANDIRRVASRYFRTDAYILSTAGKIK